MNEVIFSCQYNIDSYVNLRTIGRSEATSLPQPVPLEGTITIMPVKITGRKLVKLALWYRSYGYKLHRVLSANRFYAAPASFV